METNFSGTWLADLSQSRLLGPIPSALTAKIEQSDQSLREEILVVTANGEHRSVLECHIGGHQENAVLDGRPVRGGARWEGNELVIELWIAPGDRELHLSDHWSLSADGQVVTMEHREDALAGQRTILRRSN